MGELAEFVKRRPELIGIAVILVAILAYWQSRNNPETVDSGDVTFTGGGVRANAVDPGVIALEQTRMESGSRNIGTLASLILGEEQTSAALEARRTEVDAALRSDLSRTEAGRQVGLAGIQSNVDIAGIGARSAYDIANINANAATVAAQISAKTQAEITAANIEAARLEQQRYLESYATQRDIARVEAKSNFWDDVLGVVGSVTSALTFGLL